MEYHAHTPCAIDPGLFRTLFSKVQNFGILPLLGGKGVVLPNSGNWDTEFENRVLVVLAVCPRIRPCAKKWFWPSKTSSCIQMGMHVYNTFVCLGYLALLANLPIFGEIRDVLQLKVVGATLQYSLLVLIL